MSTYYVHVQQCGPRFGYAIRDGRGSTVAHSNTRFASATAASGAGWAKAEHLVRMDSLQGRQSFIDGTKPQDQDRLKRAAVVRAVAKALAESQVRDAQLVEQILEQVDEVLEERLADDNVPAVPSTHTQDDEQPTQHAAISR